MPYHPWGESTPEINASVIETGTTSATWAAASAAWLGLASATLATMGITGGQMMASLASISGTRSMTHQAATPPFLVWLGSMAGIAFKQAAICAVVAESYGVTRSSMIPSVQSINNRVREAAAEASNWFGQNTPLIGALNAEYGAYTMQNASIGSTYGEVITAATLPVPIPPPPPLSNAASALADAGNAMSQAGQLVSQAGGNASSQAASQASQAVGQGGSQAGGASQMSSLFSAPMQALQSAGQGMSNPLQGIQQLLSGPMQAFGQASGLGGLLNGGSTGSSFSPALAGVGGLPLGGASPMSAGLGGGGASMGGVGGMGGLSPALTSKAESSSGSANRTSVLSGISAAPTQEKLAGATVNGSPGGMAPPAAAGAGEGQRSRRGETVLASYTPAGQDAAARSAEGSERELFE